MCACVRIHIGVMRSTIDVRLFGSYNVAAKSDDDPSKTSCALLYRRLVCAVCAVCAVRRASSGRPYRIHDY